MAMHTLTLALNSTGTDSETYTSIHISTGASIFNFGVSFLSIGIISLDILAIFILLKCKLIPFCTRIFSISFILSDALGSLFFLCTQIYLFVTSKNTDLLHNIRNTGVGFFFVCAMTSITFLSLDKVFSLKFSLQYPASATRKKILLVMGCTLFGIISLVSAFLVAGYWTACFDNDKPCNIWETTKYTRMFLVGLMVLNQLTVTFSYLYILKVTRYHQMALIAMLNGTNRTPSTTWSVQQLNSYRTILSILLAFLIYYMPSVMHGVLLEAHVGDRNDPNRRLFQWFAYVCQQIYSFISLRLYVGRNQECRYVLFRVLGKCCQGYKEKAEYLRIQVFDIVVAPVVNATTRDSPV